MKRILFILTAAALTLLSAVPALAAEDPPSNVTITIVMPDGGRLPDTAAQPAQGGASEAPAAPAQSVLAAPALYPASVEELRENDGRRIIKTYALSAFENPANISREPFDRDGWHYELADVTKTETAVADAREQVETVTLNTDTKDIQAILGQLAPTLEYISEDGYAGVLTLNVASVKVEQAGTKTSSFNVSATREYPHLSSNDTSLIPKTIVDGGRTLGLAGVDWRAGNLVTVDYEQMPEYYTAVATYTGTGSKTAVTGYVTTAEYAGTIAKISPGSTVYTAYFLGAEIVPERTPLEIVEQTPAPTSEPDASSMLTPNPTNTPDAAPTLDGGQAETQSAHPSVIPVALCALLLGGGAGFFLTRKKRAVNNIDEGDTTP